MASHEGLDGLLILPEMSQDQVKRLSTLVAAHMSMCLDAACGDLYATRSHRCSTHAESFPKSCFRQLSSGKNAFISYSILYHLISHGFRIFFAEMCIRDRPSSLAFLFLDEPDVLSLLIR